MSRPEGLKRCLHNSRDMQCWWVLCHLFASLMESRFTKRKPSKNRLFFFSKAWEPLGEVNLLSCFFYRSNKYDTYGLWQVMQLELFFKGLITPYTPYIEYLPTKLWLFLGVNVARYSSTMVRIWENWPHGPSHGTQRALGHGPWQSVTTTRFGDLIRCFVSQVLHWPWLNMLKKIKPS